jgi:hypothetical protein
LRAEWLVEFQTLLRSRVRQARQGYDEHDWPVVEVRSLEPGSAEEPRSALAPTGGLAEFVAGAMIAPSRRSPREPWQIGGILYRDETGPPLVGVLAVEHFAFSPTTTRLEVTGTVLRGVPLAAIRDKALADLREDREAAARGIDLARRAMGTAGFYLPDQDVTGERARRTTEEASRPKRGRPRYSPERYGRIAVRYLELIDEGRRDVLVALAAEESERLGRPVPRETIRDWVRKATRLKYLAPGKPGRAESRPGPKLKRREN